MRWRPALVWLLAAPLLAAAPSRAQQDPEAAEASRPRIYKWVDENGIAHYTTDRGRIPAGLRGRAQPLGESDGGAAPARGAPRDGFDGWATRNRTQETATVPGDVWDEGGTATVPGPASDDGFTSAPVDPMTRAEREAEADQLDVRIAELEAAVTDDEEALKAMISDSASGGPLARGDDPEFRSIAARLPKQLAELRALRDRRAELETP